MLELVGLFLAREREGIEIAGSSDFELVDIARLALLHLLLLNHLDLGRILSASELDEFAEVLDFLRLHGEVSEGGGDGESAAGGQRKGRDAWRRKGKSGG